MGISGSEGAYTAAAIGGDATNGLQVDGKPSEIMGVEPGELRDGVEIAGVASYLKDACDSRVTLFV